MKILLSLVICSQVAGTCLQPYEWPQRFDNQYDCLMFGYQESMNQMEHIGRDEINKHNMFIRFTCTPEQIIKNPCLLYTSPSPRDRQKSRMPSSA